MQNHIWTGLADTLSYQLEQEMKLAELTKKKRNLLIEQRLLKDMIQHKKLEKEGGPTLEGLFRHSHSFILLCLNIIYSARTYEKRN